MPGFLWSDEEKSALRKLADAGYTAQEIFASNVFERSLNAIQSQGVMMGLSFYKKGEINKDAFTKMMEDRLK